MTVLSSENKRLKKKKRLGDEGRVEVEKRKTGVKGYVGRSSSNDLGSLIQPP